ncbi:MAG: ADP-glyceromanno-heptose 6-epimerase [Candidatus Aenigmarchaeota archaeon]|nr:ADP-glyceromanno-heptose 6-epimerase [Candidatus Aenigmarchaeota archaeon]
MKILITGGAGFIGSNLAMALEKSHDVTILDNLSSGKKDNLKGFAGATVEGDIRNAASLKKAGTPDVIFHEAAVTDTTITDHAAMASVNVDGFTNILNYAKTCGARVVYASSASVYGNGPVPMREEQSAPLNEYALSKLKMDKMAMDCDVRIVGLRYFNVYGSREEGKGKTASMIIQLARQMLAGKKPKIFKHGEQVRDHVYVKDVVDANLRAMKAKQNCLVNVGTGKATSFNELVSILNKTLEANLTPEYIDNPYTTAYQSNTQADTRKAEKLIGFKARYALNEGIKDYFREIGLL